MFGRDTRLLKSNLHREVHELFRHAPITKFKELWLAAGGNFISDSCLMQRLNMNWPATLEQEGITGHMGCQLCHSNNRLATNHRRLRLLNVALNRRIVC